MVGKLLMRGMLVGFVAALFSFGFLKYAGEPSVDLSIAFESAIDEKANTKASDANGHGLLAPTQQPETELVSRSVQAGAGLLTGVAVYSTAFGGLFALAFAFAFGRMGDLSPRATSALLAALGFVSVYFVPMLKYPANPPAVGLPQTIDMRTSSLFLTDPSITCRDDCRGSASPAAKRSFWCVEFLPDFRWNLYHSYDRCRARAARSQRGT